MKKNLIVAKHYTDKDFREEIEEYSPDYSSNIKFPSAKKIVETLDKTVYGQEEAKKTLALAIQNIQLRQSYPEVDLKKGNVLVIGPTGSGKTFLVDNLVKITNLPVTKGQMTSMTGSGYVGNSIDDLFKQFIIDPEKDKHLYQLLYMDRLLEFHKGTGFKLNTKNAIVYLDEIDKLAYSTDPGFSNSLQNELIGYVEDGEILKGILPTKNMLFISSGAFSGLEEIISKRVTKKGVVGFTKNEDNIKQIEELYSQVIPEDLIKYGLKPELVARFPNITYNKQLTKNDIKNILSMKTSDLSKQREVLNKAYDINLYFTKGVKELIADYVILKKENARGIQRAINIITEKYFYEPQNYSGKKVVPTLTEVKTLLKF